MSRKRFRVDVHSLVTWMSRNSFLETGAICESPMASEICEFESRCSHLDTQYSKRKFVEDSVTKSYKFFFLLTYSWMTAKMKITMKTIVTYFRRLLCTQPIKIWTQQISFHRFMYNLSMITVFYFSSFCWIIDFTLK